MDRTPRELHVPDSLRRGQVRDEERSIESGRQLIELLCERTGRADLSETSLLDVGCGVKFTQAILRYGLPIGRYVGVDVYRAMIDYLREHVRDPRFQYAHLDAHNERYNADGSPLRADSELPVAGTFDVICLFSVFTHLDPHDYVALLTVLRRYVDPMGRLLFSLYLDEQTPEGHGLMDSIAARLGSSAVGGIETFRDLDPERPLYWAVYSEAYARELIAGTGWEVQSLHRPTDVVQHHFVCSPT